MVSGSADGQGEAQAAGVDAGAAAPTATHIITKRGAVPITGVHRRVKWSNTILDTSAPVTSASLSTVHRVAAGRRREP